jgi:Pectate lyase superfamily protein
MLTVNVKQAPYNAVGNGVTDDTNAVRSAIAAAGAAGGGTVFFPAGKYRVGWLTLAQPNVELRGVGPWYDVGSVLLYYASATYGNNHLVTVSAGNCRIRGLVLDGSGGALRQAGITPGSGDGASCLTVGAAAFMAARCQFLNAYNKQVVVSGTRGATFLDCAFDAESSLVGNEDGLHLYGGTVTCEDVLVSRCRFYRHVRAGVYCDIDVRNVRIEDCSFFNELVQEQANCTVTVTQPPKANGEVGVQMQGYGDGLVVSRCTMYRYKTGVLLRAGVKRVRIEQNRFLGMMSSGVMIAAEKAVFDGASGESRFACIREQTTMGGIGYQVMAREVVIRDNLIRFQEKPGSTPELVEPTTSGAVVIIGFGTDSTYRALFDRVVVEGFVVAAPANAQLVVPQMVCVGLGADERVRYLAVVGSETASGVQRIARLLDFTNLASYSAGRGPDHFVLSRNRLRGFGETTSVRAEEVLEVTGNLFTGFRIGSATDARVLDGTAPAARVQDNSFGRKEGRLANPAYQITGTSATVDSGNATTTAV